MTTSYQRRAPTTAFGVADGHSYYLYVVNDEGSSKPLLVDVSAWRGTTSGATVIANQARPSVACLRPVGRAPENVRQEAGVPVRGWLSRCRLCTAGMLC